MLGEMRLRLLRPGARAGVPETRQVVAEGARWGGGRCDGASGAGQELAGWPRPLCCPAGSAQVY